MHGFYRLSGNRGIFRGILGTPHVAQTERYGADGFVQALFFPTQLHDFMPQPGFIVARRVTIVEKLFSFTNHLFRLISFYGEVAQRRF